MPEQERNIRSAIVEFVREASDADAGTLIFPLSSDLPVRMWHGDEVLDHSEGAVDLSWFNGGSAPVLDGHDRYSGLSKQIGVIRRAWLDGGRLYVEVKLSDRTDVAGFKADIEAGIIRNVSIGYDILETFHDEANDVHRVTKWKPTEASFVVIPADKSVGVGRSAEKPLEGNMPEENLNPTPPAPEGQRAAVEIVNTTPQGLNALSESVRADAAAAMSEIFALAAPHGQTAMASTFVADAVRSGVVPSYSAFQGKLRAIVPADQPLINRDIGLTAREKKRFSIMKLARSFAENETAEVAAFEREAARAAGEGRHGGVMLPTDIMNSWGDVVDDHGNRSSDLTGAQRAAISVGSNPNVQSVAHLSDRFIDNLRAQSAILAMGVTVLGGLEGNIEIPGGDVNAAAAWLASEDANAAESNPTFRKVTMTLKDVAAYTDFTRRMLVQSTIDVELYGRNQLMKALSEAIDIAGLQGSGATGIPRGLKNTAGIGSVLFAAPNPTWAEVVALETRVADANALMGNTGYLGTTNMRGYFKTQPKVAGQAVFLMNSNADGLNGHRYNASNLVTSGDLFFGNFSDMMMGMWGSLEFGRDLAAKFLSAGVRIRAIQSVDFGVARVGSFALGNDG